MLERVLVPLDGTPQAEGILPPLYPILRRARAEVLLVHALRPPGEGGVTTMSERRGEAREYLQTLVVRLGEQDVDAHPFIRAGSPTRAILDVAEDEEATLIAVASSGGERPEELTLGPLTQRLFQESARPVVAMHPAMPPPGEPPPAAGSLSYESILVPLDGSASSRSALPLAWEIAHLLGSRLDLLRVVERVGEADRSIPPEDSQTEEPSAEPGGIDERRALRELDELASRTSRSGVPTVAIVEKGNPADTILAVARAHRTSMIVMATRVHPEILKARMGSVGPRIMREARIPVFVLAASRAAESAEARAAGA